jgi:cation diffusion facilitator family transporter
MKTHYRLVARVLIITMLLNFGAMAVKLLAGYLTGSLSVVADGLDTLFDGLSNVIGLAGIYLASRPPDTSHPYGYRKVETFAALVISFLLFITGWEILQGAIERFQQPHVPNLDVWNLAALLLGLSLQVVTTVYERRRGLRLSSELLLADARHTLANSFVSLAVLAGLGLSRLGLTWMDPLVAIGVALAIGKIGVDIIYDASAILLDRAALAPERVEAVALKVPGVEIAHRIRTRGTPDCASIDLQIHVAPRLSITRADHIADEVAKRLMAELPGVQDVQVHVEPLHGGAGTTLFDTVKEVAAEWPLTLNEAWGRMASERLALELHVGVGRELSLAEGHAIVDGFERALRERLPQVEAVRTHIEFASDEVIQSVSAPGEDYVRIARVTGELREHVPGLLNTHNLAVESRDGKLFVALECVADGGLSIESAHALSEDVEQQLRTQVPEVNGVLVHVEPPGADAEAVAT